LFLTAANASDGEESRGLPVVAVLGGYRLIPVGRKPRRTTRSSYRYRRPRRNVGVGLGDLARRYVGGHVGFVAAASSLFRRWRLTARLSGVAVATRCNVDAVVRDQRCKSLAVSLPDRTHSPFAIPAVELAEHQRRLGRRVADIEDQQIRRVGGALNAHANRRHVAERHARVRVQTR